MPKIHEVHQVDHLSNNIVNLFCEEVLGWGWWLGARGGACNMVIGDGATWRGIHRICERFWWAGVRVGSAGNMTDHSFSLECGF
jgi:hypothetical protein